MFNRTKRYRAAKNWHSRAMLVDPRKTKLTIMNGERSDSDLAETAFEKSTAAASTEFNVGTIVSCDFPDNGEIAAEIFGTQVSFVLVGEYIDS